MKLAAPIYIKNGKLSLYDREGFTNAIADMENAGGLLELTVFDSEDQDISQMRAYYFAVIVPHVMRGLYDAQGERFSFQETHDILKYKFFSRDVVDPETGEVFKVLLSLGEAKKKEIPDFREKVLRLIEDSIFWADEFLSVKIPASDKVAVVE